MSSHNRFDDFLRWRAINRPEAGQSRAEATRETCEHSMAEAVREAVDENDGKRDLAVAVDGSWQKRGFLRRMAW
ncbi:hypothetical protein TNCV_3566141 [Trichonephila clavipes]|nr:hypothetical protein TNCV_3566141 [Trichonephila clavipes]